MKKKVGFFSALVLLIILVINFPVYRLLAFPDYMQNFYNNEQIKQVMYIGTPWDRAAVREVMDLAKEAFSDCSHSEDENDKKYGELSMYASSTDIYPETVKTKYSLKLWSVHLDDNEGYIWVYYSQKGINSDGETDYGSWRVPSLWKVEKDAKGIWAVTEIIEHP
ncbi:MAG: hypothetical protein IKC01_05480 [Clostridia bacterium]|nr:hypothetical protein [Clostridia bacterium]